MAPIVLMCLALGSILVLVKLIFMSIDVLGVTANILEWITFITSIVILPWYLWKYGLGSPFDTHSD